MVKSRTVQNMRGLNGHLISYDIQSEVGQGHHDRDSFYDSIFSQD